MSERGDLYRIIGNSYLALAELEDGTTTPAPQPPHAEEPPHAAEAAPRPNAPAWRCPIHGTSRVQPAGYAIGQQAVSKAGKTYAAFLTCGEFKCDERPPR